LAAFCGKQRPGRIGLALMQPEPANRQASKRANEPASNLDLAMRLRVVRRITQSRQVMQRHIN
jgi:hypothetical protein